MYKPLILICCLFLSTFCKKKEEKLPDPQPVPQITTVPINQITHDEAKSGGNITVAPANLIAKGICWNVNQFPTTDNYKTLEGGGSGNFTSQMTNLLPNKLYYVRAYLTDDNGTIMVIK